MCVLVAYNYFFAHMKEREGKTKWYIDIPCVYAGLWPAIIGQIHEYVDCDRFIAYYWL